MTDKLSERAAQLAPEILKRIDNEMVISRDARKTLVNILPDIISWVIGVGRELGVAAGLVEACDLLAEQVGHNEIGIPHEGCVVCEFRKTIRSTIPATVLREQTERERLQLTDTEQMARVEMARGAALAGAAERAKGWLKLNVRHYLPELASSLEAEILHMKGDPDAAQALAAHDADVKLREATWWITERPVHDAEIERRARLDGKIEQHEKDCGLCQILIKSNSKQRLTDCYPRRDLEAERSALAKPQPAPAKEDSK